VDRLERLVNLVAALIDSTRPLSRHELRHLVGGYAKDDAAFRRTFERDKDILRQIGLPLEVVEDVGDGSEDQAGYRIRRERYELADPGLSDEELAALRIAASAVRLGGDGAPVAAALAKLGAPPPAPEAELVELGGGDAVREAFGAIAERRLVTFAYRGVTRCVEPWRLAYRAGRWYLTGWDRTRAAERVFRLDRVEGPLAPLGEPAAFDPPTGGAAGPPAAWELGDGETVPVVVAVDPGHADFARAEAGPRATVTEADDGGVTITLPVRNLPALRSWVLGFLEHAEVLGPPEVRAELVRWLESLAERAG
jgi:proteasome accessory factor B